MDEVREIIVKPRKGPLRLRFQAPAAFAAAWTVERRVDGAVLEAQGGELAAGARCDATLPAAAVVAPGAEVAWQVRIRGGDAGGPFKLVIRLSQDGRGKVAHNSKVMRSGDVEPGGEVVLVGGLRARTRERLDPTRRD